MTQIDLEKYLDENFKEKNGVIKSPQREMFEQIERENMTKPKFNLLYRRVAIKEIKEENKTASGIILAEVKNPEVAKGTVVAVGDGYNDQTGKTTPMALRVGQNVMFRPGYANKYTFENEEFIFTNEADVMAVID